MVKNVTSLLITKKDLNLRWLELLKDYELVIDYHPGKANMILAELKAKPIFLQQICKAQKCDTKLQTKRIQCESISDSDYQIGSDDCLMFRDRICEPKNPKLIQKIYTKHIVVVYLFTQGQVKAEHQVPSGLLQPVMIPESKWDRVTMDFVSGLPMSLKKKDVIWVVVDRLTKSAHFIPVRTDYSLDKLAELYISEIVRLHGVPVSIILDRDLRFTSRF
ncbi:integrase [Gossypium australe]|uniref:Integrase n=1 Tax=Gossypium australe TaxID=47621 RepID=A0A5B6X2B1_9ROSI|nr:integrase [Gossypium australe]